MHRAPLPSALRPPIDPSAGCLADEGCYAGGTFIFAFKVPESYPNDPPQVTALTQASSGFTCSLLAEAVQYVCWRGLLVGYSHHTSWAHFTSTTSASRSCCQVFHPAIDTEGHVDMSLLDDEWRPEM